MKEYKVIQRMNNLMKSEPVHFNKIVVEDQASILPRAQEYFETGVDHLFYPSKSYCVAIIYSHLINFYFHESFLECLGDKDLLCGNDDYFVPYAEDKILYDLILKKINYSDQNFRLNLEISQVRATFNYFVEEFDVAPEKYLTYLTLTQ